MRTLYGTILAAVVSAATALPVHGAASFAEFDARAKSGERLTVAYFGCSLMWSANATEPNLTGFRGRMSDYLETKYPKAHFRFVDAAIGGTGAMLGVFRLDRDVLSKKPDLVFMDFVCNDGWDGKALATTCCYESLLRRIIGSGVPVVQTFFTFREWARRIAVDGEPEETVHRRIVPYRRLAGAYSTGVGDIYRDSSLITDLKGGKVALEEVWPIDGGHPCDLGYRYFADAGIRGFERAVSVGLICRVPEKPVFGMVANVSRRDAETLNCGKGWHRALTYRTSLWYDGLSSRWMDGILAFSGNVRSPLSLKAKGNLFAVFGEADEKALTAEVLCNGKKIADFNAYHRAGKGRLFFWRDALADGWECGDGTEREWTIDPVPDGVGEFRVGAICTATVVPSCELKGDAASGFDIDKIDHGRGQKE